MTTTRRHVLTSLGACASTLALPALAQGAKTTRILVGFPPGGGTDAVARVLADKLKDELGHPVVVENRPGAGGQIAAQALKAAPADGSVIFLSHDHTISILPQVTKNPGYDPATDFTPVAGFASFVNAFALSGGTPAKTFTEYLTWVRESGGGKGSVGIPAPSSTPEFLVKLIARKFNVDLVPVPYRGGAPMMADMLGNQIAAGVASVPDFIENHKAGKLRVVGVLGVNRQAVLPDVPTFHEMGLTGFEDLPYYGFFAPTGTPAAWIDSFGEALSKVVRQGSVRERLGGMGLDVGYMNRAQLGERERAYTAVWSRIVKTLGVVPQ